MAVVLPTVVAVVVAVLVVVVVVVTLSVVVTVDREHRSILYYCYLFIYSISMS